MHFQHFRQLFQIGPVKSLGKKEGFSEISLLKIDGPILCLCIKYKVISQRSHGNDKKPPIWQQGVYCHLSSKFLCLSISSHLKLGTLKKKGGSRVVVVLKRGGFEHSSSSNSRQDSIATMVAEGAVKVVSIIERIGRRRRKEKEGRLVSAAAAPLAISLKMQNGVM